MRRFTAIQWVGYRVRAKLRTEDQSRTGRHQLRLRPTKPTRPERFLSISRRPRRRVKRIGDRQCENKPDCQTADITGCSMHAPLKD